VIIEIEAVAHIRTARSEAEDDYWGGEPSCIVLADRFESTALEGIEAFSHVEVLFCFDKVEPHAIVESARHPRGNTAWPAVGIFAQRGKNRPNRLGTTVCRLVRREGRELHVVELDAIDGTPVFDLKPVMQEFLPREPVQQPQWSNELMKNYWKRSR
jgi:tRNA-Thr(GGU) m(6)t(6)A37 methyltransferase TsaA